MSVVSRERVSLVARPLDLALSALRFLLLPVLVVLVSLQGLQVAADLLSIDSSGWQVGAATVVIVAAYGLIIQTPAIAGSIDIVFATARRRVVIACDRRRAARRDSRLACLLTPAHLRAHTFRYDQQSAVVKSLAAASASTDACDFWFIEGASGSGKTRTALLLVEALLRDPETCHLTARCFLYDFAAADAEERLISMLGTSRHEGAVVLVDNFQLVRAESIRDLTKYLVDSPARAAERIFVFLSRPITTWNLSPGSDVRLVSHAKRAGHHVELSGPPEEQVTRAVSDVDRSASLLVQSLDGGVHRATAAQLHLGQIIASHQAVPPVVQQTLRVLNRQIDEDPPEQLLRFLAIISGLAMHRGSFQRRDFRWAARATRAERSGLSRVGDAFKMRILLWRMRRIGLVPRVHLGGARYLFHEAIAELCIDRLAPVPGFLTPFEAVGRARLRALASTDSGEVEWLVACEIGDEDAMTRAFDQAMFSGGYTQMVNCLRRRQERGPFSPRVRLQYAILLDRVGDFVESRAEFGATELPDASDELVAQFIAAQVEASHADDTASQLEPLRSHHDPFVSAVARYWDLHIGAHLGDFKPHDLEALAERALTLAGGRPGHWVVYSVGRMHFDALRHGYLAGSASPEAIAGVGRSAVAEYLRTRLPAYEALNLLYTKAHLVGHVLLPRHAVFRRPVTDGEAAMVERDVADLAHTGGLAEWALRLYRRARDEFWQYGDREASYLQADILNALMIQDDAKLDEVYGDLLEYDRFMRSTGFRDMASYPSLYYLRWHILKYYAVLLDADTSDASTADEYLDDAKRHLRRIGENDASVGNRYGVFRRDVLSALLDGVTGSLPATRLQALRTQARADGYGIEFALLEHISNEERTTPAQLRTIFRFYPFVHQ